MLTNINSNKIKLCHANVTHFVYFIRLALPDIQNKRGEITRIAWTADHEELDLGSGPDILNPFLTSRLHSENVHVMLGYIFLQVNLSAFCLFFFSKKFLHKRAYKRNIFVQRKFFFADFFSVDKENLRFPIEVRKMEALIIYIVLTELTIKSSEARICRVNTD